jgi:hypothetical protein
MTLGIRDAFRSRLALGFTALPYVEELGSNPTPSARPAGGFVTMNFQPIGEEHMGGNQYRERGLAQVHIFTPSGTGDALAVTYADAVRALFRGAIFAADTDFVRVDGVDAANLGAGSADGRWFRATVAMEYWYNHNS